MRGVERSYSFLHCLLFDLSPFPPVIAISFLVSIFCIRYPGCLEALCVGLVVPRGWRISRVEDVWGTPPRSTGLCHQEGTFHAPAWVVGAGLPTFRKLSGRRSRADFYLIPLFSGSTLSSGRPRVLEFQALRIHFSSLLCQGVRVVPEGFDCFIHRHSVRILSLT